MRNLSCSKLDFSPPFLIVTIAAALPSPVILAASRPSISAPHITLVPSIFYVSPTSLPGRRFFLSNCPKLRYILACPCTSVHANHVLYRIHKQALHHLCYLCWSPPRHSEIAPLQVCSRAHQFSIYNCVSCCWLPGALVVFFKIKSHAMLHDQFIRNHHHRSCTVVPLLS